MENVRVLSWGWQGQPYLIIGAVSQDCNSLMDGGGVSKQKTELSPGGVTGEYWKG